MVFYSLSSFAAETELKADVDVDDREAKVEADVDREDDKEINTRQYRDREPRVRNNVLPRNKASRVVGMEIRNRENEKLGVVKDLVLDLESQKISYVVVAIGGFLGVGEKLLAVPPTAFSESTKDDGILILDADRAKIQAAPGFAATNWPEVENPDLDARTFWMDDASDNRPERRGTAASSEVRSSSDRNRKVQVDSDLDRDSGNASVTARSQYEDVRTIRGKIQSVDVDGRKITIETDNGNSRQFRVGRDATLLRSRNTNPGLIDYRVGETVELKYHTENGKTVVHQISRR
ncbi:MAG: PRC-barrel domain-containing protein [Verrucomicrobiota bacterium]|nr:PRC-barrel domain-containing protein [Verrucomicrobiota bacterium]